MKFTEVIKVWEGYKGDILSKGKINIFFCKQIIINPILQTCL